MCVLREHIAKRKGGITEWQVGSVERLANVQMTDHFGGNCWRCSACKQRLLRLAMGSAELGLSPIECRAIDVNYCNPKRCTLAHTHTRPIGSRLHAEID